MKRYYSILDEGAVRIYTYDGDSDAFQPLLYHSFNLKNLKAIGWSPLGSYLLCLGEKELCVLHTEPPFQEIVFPAGGLVGAAVFSPKENYISLLYWVSENQPDVKLEVWEAKTGNIRISFCGSSSPETYFASVKDYLKWDYNDNYFAVRVSSSVIIYETKTFSPLKHLMFKQVQEFDWSPSASILAVFGNSYLKIVDICSGKKLYGYSWEGVEGYKLLWQSAGEYLACICSGTNYKKIFLISLKSGKAGFISPRLDYIDFAWEGNGKQFAVTRGANEVGQTTTNFYTIQEDGKYLRHRIKTLKGMIAHFLHWSPNGHYMVMQGPLNGSGELYFYDIKNHQLLALVYFIAMDLRWDGSGRFFLTRASPKNIFESVVRIWSSHGEKLIDVGSLYLPMFWSTKVSCDAGNSEIDLTKESSSYTRDGEHFVEKRPIDDSTLALLDKLRKL
ncbi:eukaryotic translation initiation factor 3 subunit B-like [Chenopodium quinoa]|uniref:eukaryotic translation initiation factor 3 subunit B-like n=1 Tax=Chenopodium quinoa TaxID=63459 RepID=UPI000B7737EF|nr:eukaryotic translation initiation factor 3 subunit B-like [Chenopodium quinoa]XP_021715437.1 eukaryotic translation initiation factor 3 subunit B-like [Chenopodium quinoa]XP_021715438.1 eukaryotic translation initiation factor 3 subunit B-like [Chenopodium quinoa]